MNEFWIYFQLGLNHVLDINGYDHVLFIVALAAPFVLKNWKKVLLLVSIFTVGHTISLFLSVFEIMTFDVNFIEFLIPVTILITAIHNFFKVKKTKTDHHFIEIILSLFFGLIHGFGFSNYFKTILPGKTNAKLFPLVEFALGIEAAQVILVLFVLIFASIFQLFFKVSRRDWIIILSSIIIGVIIPIFLEKI